MNNRISINIKVKVSEEEAFNFFVNHLNKWWPNEYTWSQEKLERIHVEQWQGGKCFEEGPNGFHLDWGRVSAYESPRRIVFTWQISPSRVPVPDASKASEVEVRFTSISHSETLVEFEHRFFERHGDGADKYREMMNSDAGWRYILECYVKKLVS